MMIKESIAKIVEHIDLEEEEMSEVLDEMMEGRATDSQMAALLVGLRMKGESISEITGAARTMLEKAQKVSTERDIVDLCGTGGDQQGTFNISTTAAFIAAGAGVTVAKHGNRSISSLVGSADVLEKLGININISPQSAEKCLEETGIVFLFAPVFHTAMKHVATSRKEVGIRTIFNILGPIVNPAGVKRQVMGVYSETLVEPVVKVFRNLDYKRAMVVHGSDALDEITVTGKTTIAELKEGMTKKYYLDPTEYGIKKGKPEELKGGSLDDNANILLSILRAEEQGSKRDIALLNAAAAIVVADVADELGQALEMARESIDSGKAMAKLEELKNTTAKLN